MAEYVTTTDQNVALNNTIPFNSVSIPCNTGSVVPLAPGIINLKGNTSNRFVTPKNFSGGIFGEKSVYFVSVLWGIIV